MNTDMIPNGPRDDIETDLEINSEIAAIAGAKFFDWINDLCRSEEKFFVADIFSLIPDFEACSKGVGKKYSKLIGRFQTEFERRLLSEKLIPTAAGGYACLKDIIIDETSITLSGMLDERQFLEFSGLHGVLPAKELGGDKNFRKFAKRYADELHVFSRKDLHSMSPGSVIRGTMTCSCPSSLTGTSCLIFWTRAFSWRTRLADCFMLLSFSMTPMKPWQICLLSARIWAVSR